MGAGLAVVVAGLAIWGLVTRMSGDQPQAPPEPPPTAVSTPSRSMLFGPPPWVRYPTPLEGRWVSESPAGRVNLRVHNYSLEVWQGVGRAQGLPLGRRLIVVTGDRVHVRTSGQTSESVTYVWRIVGDRLSFDPVEGTPESPSLLAGRTFDRS